MIQTRNPDGSLRVHDRGHVIDVRMVDTDTAVAVVNGMPMPAPAVSLGAAIAAARRVVDALPHSHAGFKPQSARFTCCIR